MHWLLIFAAPFEEPEMFWIMIPIWISWFFAEFFNEKHGTSAGNAISNGIIPIIASIDWIRYLFRLLSDGTLSFTLEIFLKFVLSIAVFVYGVFVTIAGIKAKKIVLYIGRIRWVTYVLVIVTPIIYNVIKLDLQTLLAVILFFPIYLGIIEIFDRITPEPKNYQQEEQYPQQYPQNRYEQYPQNREYNTKFPPL